MEKADEILPSSSSSPLVKSDESTSTTRDPCPVCLGPFVDESYLDTCFRKLSPPPLANNKFCFKCIIQWSKVVATKDSHVPSSLKCPLCKVDNFSIIHEYVGGSSFQRHFINPNHGESYFFSKAHKYRLQCFYADPGNVEDIFDISRFWKSRKYLQLNRWLETWMKRELQALMQEEDVDIIVHHIVGMIDSFLKRIEKTSDMKTHETIQEEFEALVSDVARPFLRARTDRFIKEMELFLASGLNIEAYDAVYLQRLGWNDPKVTSYDTELSETSYVVPYLFAFDGTYQKIIPRVTIRGKDDAIPGWFCLQEGKRGFILSCGECPLRRLVSHNLTGWKMFDRSVESTHS
ncbi:hypothetical protein ACFE04_005527 [Oxalis oulophora]